MILLLLIAFLESFATTCMERGIYFYTHDALRFSEAWNLWLALPFGVAYVAGALSSHALSLRLRERPLLIAAIAGQLLMHLLLAGRGPAWSVYACFTAIGLLNGAKWPVIESYISAGKSGRGQARAIGVFNASWAAAVPLALAAVGPLKEFAAESLFLLPAGINLACLLLCLKLGRSPAHLAAGHAHLPSEQQAARLGALLVSNRWLMLASYTILFLLAPLLPDRMAQLRVSKEIAPAMSGLIDVLRLAAFIVLGGWTAWHGRVYPIVVSLVAMPAGLFMVLFGTDLATVVGGEVIFGLSAGTIYYGALFYAMAVKNASVEGGGAHEGLIGSGFALGPALGLVSIALLPAVGGRSITATLLAIGPVLALCSVVSLLPLWRARRMLRRDSTRTL